MAKFTKDSKIIINKQEKTIASILETIIYYPAVEATEFFKQLGMSFPRSLRIDVLRDVLREPVMETRDDRATLADEMNYRLSWFNQYTESQLVNLFDFYKDNELEKNFLEEFWIAIINYITEKHIDEKDFEKLIEASVQHVKDQGLKLPDLVKYNAELDPLFFDVKGEIDGLTPDVFRPVLYKSSTLTEIRDLGKKYGVNVPRRLRKAELLEIIFQELRDRDELTKEKEAELSKMSVLLIQRFAKTNNIKVSTELKKEEVIEYILANANETKETYFAPSSSVYEVEVEDIGEAMPEVNVEEFDEDIEEEIKELEEEVQELEEEIEIIKEEVVEEELEEVEEPKKRSLLANIVIFTLVLILQIIIFIVLYALITHKVQIDFLEGFDKVINAIKISGKGLLDILREWFSGLIN